MLPRQRPTCAQPHPDGQRSPQAQEHAGDPYPPTPESQKPSHSNSVGDASRHCDSLQPCAGPRLSRTGERPFTHTHRRGRGPQCPREWAVPQLRARVPQLRARVPRAQSLCPLGWAVPQLRAFLGAHRPPQPAQELMSSHPQAHQQSAPGPD